MDERFSLEFSLVAETDVPAGVSETRLEALTHFILAAEEATGSWEVSIALVGDERLQALHRDFMGVDAPTDIMTFPFGGEPGSPEAGGELVVSVDHAKTQAAAWGLTPAGEVEFLTAHGVLHLLGWRDDTDDARDRMLARQELLIGRWRAESADAAMTRPPAPF